MLTADELSTLKQLEEKAKIHAEAMTNDELMQVERRIRDAIDKSPQALGRIVDGWGEYTAILKGIANDNARLMAEIQRLRTKV